MTNSASNHATPLNGSLDQTSLDQTSLGQPDNDYPGLADAIKAEWIKFTSLRSTRWTLVTMFVLGVGLTALVCATSANWLASGDADQVPATFITWGLTFAQITAVVLGTLIVTNEYGNGLMRSSLAAMPRRGRVVAAKVIVLAPVLFIGGVTTAACGYLAGNYFFEAEGIGISLNDDGVLRALIGSGLYMAGLGVLALAAGLLLRHTAAALTSVLAVIFVLGSMVSLLPGDWAEWLGKFLPGQAGQPVAVPVTFDPTLLGPWVGYTVFMSESLALLAIAYVLFARRDA